MRHALALIAVLTVAGSAVAATPPAAGKTAGAPVFVITGGGWGHNVGLSQWGAYGQAKAGRTYERILRHYFAGSKLGLAPVKKVRVLVAEGARTATIGSTAPFRVRDGAGAVHQVYGWQIRLGRALRVPVALAPGGPGPDGLAGPGRKHVKLAPPLTFLPAPGATMALDGKGFRGRLEVTRVGATLRVVMAVSLEAYVQGIVPGEMPGEWPLEALKAQAVAARTYAVAKFEQGKEWDVVADERAFAYYGVGAETPSTNQAVRETRGEVLMYGGKAITAFYFSSSGGRTLSAQDVFGVALPYLRGAKDPWDEASPHHLWPARTFTPASLALLLGAGAPVADVQVVPSAPGRPLAFQIATTTGENVAVRGADVRLRLGLKSPNFRIGVLRLVPLPTPVVAGEAVTLEGIARDVGETVLEERGSDGLWKPAKKLVLQADGSFAAVLRPAVTSAYRLVAAGLIGPSLTVKVAEQATG
jgi:SpoIID/LytB domain protein